MPNLPQYSSVKITSLRLAIFGLLVISLITLVFNKRCDLFDIALANEYRKSGLTEYTHDMAGLKVSYATNHPLNPMSNLASTYAKNEQEVLVMLHGFAAQKEYWLRLAANLSQKYHIIIIDLLGHGRSSSDIQLPYSIESQTDFINQFLTSMDITSFHLIGNSMGAMVSAQYSVKFANQVKSLSLISPAGIYDIPTKVNEYIDQGTNPLVVSNSRELSLLVNLAMVQPPFLPWPINVVVAEKLYEKNSQQKKIFKVLKLIKEDFYKEVVRRIQLPVFITWGRSDRIVSVENLDIYRDLIDGAVFKVYADVGHAPMIEIPRLLAKDLDFFIRNSKLNN